VIVVKLDMTGPGRGLALITGDHGFPESPQALIGKHTESRWYVEDSYGDKDRDGQTTRADFYGTDRSALKAVKRWMRALGIDPDDTDLVRIDQDREY
jgi:hypothetical protein